MMELAALLRSRALRVLGSLSMYRLVLFALAALTLVAFVVSFGGQLSATPLALVASAAVLIISTVLVDVIAHRIVRTAFRIESSLITALILLFVLWPSTEPSALGVLALAGAAASASKYVIAIRSRHLLNPAAVGAAVVTTTGLGASMWWVGSPLLAGFVVVFGLAVVIRSGQLATSIVFILVASVTGFVFSLVQSIQFAIPYTMSQLAIQALVSSPVLFLGLFMLTEPLTLPARRGWRLVVAAVVGLGVGWPVLGPVLSIRPEIALLVGNLLAFAVSVDRRRTVRMTLVQRRALSPTVTELTLRPARSVPFDAGQYVELAVPHARPDARGTRREFSIASSPDDEHWRLAYRTPVGARVSTYKRALADLPVGAPLIATGVNGAFSLPDDTGVPVLLVAGGIGVTPFVSHLAADRAARRDRDVVIVLVASSSAESLYLSDLAATGARGVVITPDAPQNLPDGWSWGGGSRLNAASLSEFVPDIARRRAYVSGPPSMIAELAPTLKAARSVRTDAFAGY